MSELIHQAVSMSLTVFDRNERPSKLLSVLLRQRAAADALCDLGASAATGQVRTLKGKIIRINIHIYKQTQNEGGDNERNPL